MTICTRKKSKRSNWKTVQCFWKLYRWNTITKLSWKENQMSNISIFLLIWAFQKLFLTKLNISAFMSKGKKKKMSLINIFSLSNKWLLNTRQSYFQIENMKEEGLQDIGVKIQLVLNNGFHMKAENITPIIIDKSKIISLTSILE